MRDIDFIHKLPGIKLVESREELILSYCKGKTVLDLGCLGSALTVQSLHKGDLLHLKSRQVASNVVGVDIDKNGINFLTDQGIPNLVRLDVQEIDKLKLDIPINVILAGEILEHLENPGLFLKSISKLMSRNESILIITVPNAFSLRNFFSVLVNRKEMVRSDHKYYFSYVTIKCLLNRYNLRVIGCYAYSNLRRELTPLKKSMKKLLNRTVLRFSPFLAEGLIVIAGKEKS